MTGGGDVAAATGSLAAPDGSELGLLDVGRRLSRGFRATLGQPRRSGAPSPAAAPIDQTDPCPSGGTVRIFGTVNDSDGTGTVSVVYSNCVIGGEGLSGSASMRVDAYDLFNNVVTDLTLSFARLTIRGSANVDLTGSVRTQVNLGTNTETVTENVIALYNNSGHMTKSENLVFVDAYNNIFFPSSYAESISGRVFDNVHGFVDIITNAPFVFGSVSQLFPHTGQIVLTGAAAAHVRVSAVSSALTELGIDLNGDNTYELAARLGWDELSSPAAADLADDDDDGMHNSWETANNATDPAADPDGDGQSNLAEYQAGTDPHVAGGAPLPPPPLPPPPGPTLPAPTPVTAQVISLANVGDLAFDSVTQRIYAAVRTNPGGVVPIDPVGGALGTPIAVGANPFKLARSDDGQFLYVGLDGEPAVDRIKLAAPAGVDLQIPLTAFGDHFVDDLEVLPGGPQSIAVSLRNKGFSPRHEGVLIFDGAMRRAGMTPDHTGSNVIEFSASSATLYGYNNETTGFGFYRMAVAPTGVTVSDVFDSFMPNNAGGQGLISGFGVDIEFGGGLIFATTGAVVDPVARTLLGTLLLPSSFGNSVVADGGLGRVFYLSRDFVTSTWGIVAYDIATRNLLGYGSIAGVNGTPGSLIRWGAKGLAFRTSEGQIFLVESALLIP